MHGTFLLAAGEADDEADDEALADDIDGLGCELGLLLMLALILLLVVLQPATSKAPPRPATAAVQTARRACLGLGRWPAPDIDSLVMLPCLPGPDSAGLTRKGRYE